MSPLRICELFAGQRRLVVGVDVSIRTLSFGDQLDDGFGQGEKPIVGELGELPADCLEPLVDVRVQKWGRVPGIVVCAAIRAARPSSQLESGKS